MNKRLLINNITKNATVPSAAASGVATLVDNNLLNVLLSFKKNKKSTLLAIQLFFTMLYHNNQKNIVLLRA